MQNGLISDYFSEEQPGQVSCKQCSANGSSTYNLALDHRQELMDHLMDFHGVLIDLNQDCTDPHDTDEGDFQPNQNTTFDTIELNVEEEAEIATVVLELEGCPPKKKRSAKPSLVWKHFCYNTTVQNNSPSDTDNRTVYCIHCLNENTITRYREGTSTTSLKYHLKTIHNLDLVDSVAPELLLPDPSLIERVAVIECEASNEQVKPKRAIKSNHHTYQSKTRRFFRWFETGENSFCLLCAEEGIDHIYHAKTSTSTMKRHLVQIHNCDPETDDRPLPVDEEIFVLPEETWDLINERIERVTGRVGHYFITLPNEGEKLFCCFCLKESLKQGYEPTTGVTNLRRHLVARHNYVGPVVSSNSEKVVYRAEVDEKLSDEIVELARKRAATTQLKPRQYFMRIDDTNTEVIYCCFCLLNRIKYEYNENSSVTSLRHHLETQHEVKLRKRKLRVIEDSTQSSNNEDYLDINNEEIEMSDEAPVEEEIKLEVVTEHEPLPSLVNTCRACGKTELNFTINIFDVLLDINDTESVPMKIALKACTGITATPSDQKSQIICYLCMASLKSAYQFYTKAREVESNADQIVQTVRDNSNEINS